MHLLAQILFLPNFSSLLSTSSLSPPIKLAWLTTIILLLSTTCLYCSQVAHSTNTNQLDNQIYESAPSSTSTPTSTSTQTEDLYENNSFKAIRTLHSKLDVDADGEVDDLESKKFLESGKINQGANGNNKEAGAYSTAHKLRYLHQDGKDRSISVDELWEAWKSSQVHNWTVEETVYWLVNYVELPEYSHIFEQNSVNGSLLPRLATDSQFISSKLGITDPSAKSRISIKAMDVVLFGPPKLGNASRVPYIIVNVVILIAISSCYVFYSRSRASQIALQEIQEHLESLQKAQDQLKELQHQSDQSKAEGAAVGSDKRQDRNSIDGDNRTAVSNVREQKLDLYVAKLEEEIKCLREELNETNDSIASKKFRAPFQLRSLLQETYNIESQFYNDKKLSLESKATMLKLRNQKLQKKKSSFLGYYKMAQENSLEEELYTIKEVKESYTRMAREVKERSARWRTIEELCGCSLDLMAFDRTTLTIGDVTRTAKLTSNHKSASNLHSMGSSLSSCSSKSHLE